VGRRGGIEKQRSCKQELVEKARQKGLRHHERTIGGLLPTHRRKAAFSVKSAHFEESRTQRSLAAVEEVGKFKRNYLLL